MNEALPAGQLAALLGDWSTSGAGSLARRLAGALRSRILADLLPTGTRLPPERRLAAALAVSRSTVVAALDELRAEGLVASRVGSGTVVLIGGPPGAGAPPSLVDRALLGGAGINLAVSAPPDAGYLPDLALTVADLAAAVPAHGYEPAGHPALRSAIAARHTAGGLWTRPSQIHVTCGAQQAIDLTLAVLARPGERVLVEDPTYPGVLDVLARRRLVAVPVAAEPAHRLAAAVRRCAGAARPAAVYLLPAVHNPTGRVLAHHDRVELAAALDELAVPVVEDNTLADLAFAGARPPSLAQLCTRAPVLSVESLSKLVWGGLRVGWLRGSQSVVERTVRLRHHSDLATSTPSQLLALKLLDHVDELASRRRTDLACTADRFATALALHLPDWEIRRPSGGLSVWARLPAGSATAFAQRAARHGVAVTPGEAASVGPGSRHVRLCYDRPWHELVEGVARLARAWADAGQRNQGGSGGNGQPAVAPGAG